MKISYEDISIFYSITHNQIFWFAIILFVIACIFISFRVYAKSLKKEAVFNMISILFGSVGVIVLMIALLLTINECHNSYKVTIKGTQQPESVFVSNDQKLLIFNTQNQSVMLKVSASSKVKKNDDIKLKTIQPIIMKKNKIDQHKDITLNEFMTNYKVIKYGKEE